MAIDTAAFIQRNLKLQRPALLPELVLYLAHPGSGLSRFAEEDDTPPYWAYLWPGGALLARYFLDRPQRVKGLSIFDLGTGCGVVAIAAAKAGAVRAIANDIDARALAAAGVNADANGVTIETLPGDVLDGPVPDVDLIALGDLFFHAETAVRVLDFSHRCVGAGKTVLVGDLGRAYLPREYLLPLANYDVTDFGDGKDTGLRTGTIYCVDKKKAALGAGAAFSNARSGTG